MVELCRGDADAEARQGAAAGRYLLRGEGRELRQRVALSGIPVTQKAGLRLQTGL